MRLSFDIPAFGLAAVAAAAPVGAQNPSDFNLDGWDDLVVGVPQDDSFVIGGFVFPGPGAVHVIYGGACGLTLPGNQLWTQALLAIPEANGDQFGASIACGDFDGNGFQDIAIGAPDKDDLVADQGAVIVMLNSAFGFSDINTRVLTKLEFSCGPPVEDDRYGHALVAADFNLDGFDDLAIGIPNNDLGAIDAGAVHVRYGDPTGFGVLGTFQCLHQDTIGVVDSNEADDHFGSALAAGDFNGDGFPDLAIGVPDEDLATLDNGAVNVLDGSAAGLVGVPKFLTDIVCGGQEKEDRYGTQLASGDFDADGVDDLAVGIPYEDITTSSGTVLDAGAVDIRYGIPAGSFQAGICFSLDDPLLPSDAEDGDQLGFALTVGDFDGSAPEDLAIGAPRKDVGAALGAGAVLVLIGQPVIGLSSSLRQGLIDCTPEGGDHFGQALTAGNFGAPPGCSSVGDDLVIGVPNQTVGTVTGAGALQIRYGGIGPAGLLGPGYCGDQEYPGLLGVAGPLELFASGLPR